MIRGWQRSDAAVLRPMIAACLRETVAAGADILPTDANVDALLAIGMAWAEAGEPTLLATDEHGRVIGYVLWGANGKPTFELRRATCLGLGTYTLRPYRRQHVAVALRHEAAERAKAGGAEVVQGVCYDEPALKSAIAAGFKVVAWQVELAL